MAVYSFVGNEPTPLDHLQKLKTERNLSDQDIDRLGIIIVSSVSTKEELGWPEPNALIKIPYWGITGEKLLDNRGYQLCRYRRTVLNDKGERYTQRRGTGSRHFLSKGVDWLEVSRNADIPLYYTEGEFKSIAGCRGLGPTVGNAGVNAWRGPNGLAAPLDEFIWKGRNVFIVYDAESTSTSAVPLKGTVVKALGELAVELMVRGAIVKQLLIAKTGFFVEGTKLGLDDYFQVGGTKEALLATACDPVIDEDLARMFARYAVFVGAKPHILDIKTGIAYSAKEFVDYIETQTRVVDGKPHKLANLYREHPDRNVVIQYVFDPNLPSGYSGEHRTYNTWRGFATEPVKSPNYDANVARYLRFTEGVWGTAHFNYFLDWAAQLFQYPGTMTTISPIIVSRVKGIGKSLSGLILRSLIGEDRAFVGTVNSLTEKFSGQLDGKIFVQIDEADALFDGKESKLKALDSDKLVIRKMNTDGYNVKNILRKFYTTNENAAFRIAADERRYFVVRSAKGEEDGEADSPWLHFIKNEVVPIKDDRECLGDLMEFFMLRDISHWDPGAPVPRTDAMMDMVEAGESKKHTISRELFDALAPMGMWATDKTMSAVDQKMWGDVRAIHKDKGGRTVQHVFNSGDGAKPCSIWMDKDHLLNITEDPKKGARLAAGQLGGDAVKALLLTTRNHMERVMRLVDAGKF